MKKILIIFIALPTILLSQNNVELTKEEYRNINQSIINCLTDYKNESKVTRRNIDEFYEVFVEDESIINDLIPSESYNEFINCSDWIDLMKGIKVYNVETDIIEFKEYNTINKDSGIVRVIINKTVHSAVWSDKVKPDFNILLTVGNEERSQKVKYSSSNKYEFIFAYKLAGTENSYSQIVSIKPYDKLNRVNVYVPYKKSLGQQMQIMETVDFVDTNLYISGDHIKHFIDSVKINLADYNIIGYRKPRLKDSDKSVIKNLVYDEKWPFTASVYMLGSDKSEIIQFGDKITPSNIEYSERLNAAISVYLFKAKQLSFGLKGHIVNSTIDIEIDSYENTSELSNPISNHENTYTRKNTITDFKEQLSVDQKMVGLSLSYTFSMGKKKKTTLTSFGSKKDKKIKQELILFATSYFWHENLITSKREASSKYTGIFHNEFEIEIDEQISYNINGDENTLELGYKDWDIEEDIELVQEMFSVYEVGFMYKIPMALGLSLGINGIYKGNLASWFENSSEEISKDINEFNSFTNFSERIQMNGRFSFGVSLSIQL